MTEVVLFLIALFLVIVLWPVLWRLAEVVIIAFVILIAVGMLLYG